MPASSISVLCDDSAAPVSWTQPREPWVNVLSHLDPKYGGMSAAVPALSSAVAEVGKHAVALAGFCAVDEEYSHITNRGVPVHRIQAGYANWVSNKAARDQFQKAVYSASGVHIHGLWEPSSLIAARAAKRANKPYLISAHGMLQPWALNNKRWKKAIYGALIERSNLQGAACLHALTKAEADDYRAYGLTNPIAVIPNGVDIPAHADSELLLNEFPELRGKRLILFLSRIHFKKGLDILCRAWSSVAKRWPDAHLVLAGPDFENTRSSIEALIAAAKLTERVTFTGMLDNRLKWSALRAAECFVLPSYSEGLSVSVLEAMGMALPVIVTRQCNLPEVKEYGCGWVIEPNSDELAAALDGCLALPVSARAEMSRNGQSLIEKSYSWQVVGEQMSSLYSWMQGESIPDNFPLDLGGKP
jgi:glycosyltransferase involved in cell wall biosynthesis